MNKIQYVVLYTSFLLIANILSANETKFGELNNLKFGDMKEMILSNNLFSAPKNAFFDQDGKELTLQEFQGRVTLVNFWATWCAPCREEMPSLETLSNQLGSDDTKSIISRSNKINKIEFYLNQSIIFD